MNKVYIKGVPGRGKEVIAKLEELGGKNEYNYGGERDAYYFINVDGDIDYTQSLETQTLIKWIGEEIFLDGHIEKPKREPKFKAGDKVYVDRADGKQRILETGSRDSQGEFDYYAAGCSLKAAEHRIRFANTLKEYDPVIVSNDGSEWCCALYYKNRETYPIYMSNDNTGTIEWKYIVPLSDFDFNDLESNIKKSIV